MFPQTLRLIIQTTDKLQAHPSMTTIHLDRAYYLQDLQHLLQHTYYEKGRWHFSAKTHTHHIFSTSSMISPRGRFHRRTKPFMILLITLGRVIRTPPNLHDVSGYIPDSDPTEKPEFWNPTGLQVGTPIGRCQKTPDTLWIKLGIELWFCLHKPIRVTHRDLTNSFKP